MCRQTLGATVGRNTYSCGSGGSLAALNYLEIKLIMDRRSTQQKQGRLTDAEVKVLVKVWLTGGRRATSTRQLLTGR
jgi:hypothetical protein